MSAMTDVTVTGTWTQLYSASGAATVVLENRSLNQDVLVHVSQTLVPNGDAAAFTVRRYLEGRDSHFLTLTLASGDELYAKVRDNSGTTARLTLMTP